MSQPVSPRYSAIVFLVSMMLLFFLHTPACAEPSTGSAADRLMAESTVLTGYGNGHIGEGHYQPLLLIWHVGTDLNRLLPALQRGTKGRLYAFLEPQINPVTAPEANFEAGFGCGLKYLYPLSDRISVYVLASVGLQYISVVTEDQANKLNFAELIGAGVYYFLTKNSAINLGYRFRHISNAGLERPNGGINTQFGTIGYSVFF